MEGYSFTDIIWYVVVGLILLIFIYIFVSDYLRKRKAKKLKYEWNWIVKKTKVFKIWEKYESWDDYSYYLYRLESKDETWNVYCSEDFKDAEYGWRTLEDMIIKYDGVTYDLSDKDKAIKQLNDNLHRLEAELQNDPWFFRKRELKKDIEAMKNYIDIANEWPIDTYLVCNGHKISVWDSVDVFVDPENPNLYYFDLDFTKQN